MNLRGVSLSGKATELHSALALGQDQPSGGSLEGQGELGSTPGHPSFRGKTQVICLEIVIFLNFLLLSLRMALRP